MTVRANTERSETARSAHVPPSVSLHARADLGDMFRVDDPEFMAWLEYERQAVDQLENPDPFRDAVSAELVACTLGQRRHVDRLELRYDVAARVLRAIRALKALALP